MAITGGDNAGASHGSYNESNGNIVIIDNTSEFLALFNAAKLRGLEKIGMQAEKYAKQECPVDTGRLRNSITHIISGMEAFIGTAVEYGKYVEFGTGRQADTGGNPLIKGHAPHPYLRPAATQHGDVYKKLFQSEFKNIK